MVPSILCPISLLLLLFSFLTEDWLNFLNTNQITHHLKFLTKASLLLKGDLSPSSMSHGFLHKPYPDWPLEVWSSFKCHKSLSPAPPPLCAELPPPVCSSLPACASKVCIPNAEFNSSLQLCHEYIPTVHYSPWPLPPKNQLLNKYWLIEGKRSKDGWSCMVWSIILSFQYYSPGLS